MGFLAFWTLRRSSKDGRAEKDVFPLPVSRLGHWGPKDLGPGSENYVYRLCGVNRWARWSSELVKPQIQMLLCRFRLPPSIRKGSDGTHTRKRISQSKTLIAWNLKCSCGALASSIAREMFQHEWMGLAPTGSWRASEGVALNVKATRGITFIWQTVSPAGTVTPLWTFITGLQGGESLDWAWKSRKKRQEKVHCNIYTVLLSGPIKRLFPSQPINWSEGPIIAS